MRKTRTTQRRLREKNDTPTIALVGYTNAGKSTLLNKLTDSDIHTGDRLFDTLDTTTRRLRLNDTLEVLVSDTVGFIRKLPHHLIEAFKATLEELCYAQLLLHVIDVSNPDWEQQAEIVEKLIRELGAESTPIIKVYNKCDKLGDSFIPKDTGSIMVSARSGENLDRLIEEMIRILDNSKRVTLHIPYSKAGLLDMLHNEAGCVDVEYCQEYIKVSATCNAKLYGRVREYAVEVE